MTSQYDNLAVIHHDYELLWSQFSKVLSTPFHPKNWVEPGILAACIRISNSEQNLEYLGGYSLQKINSDNRMRQSLPLLVAEAIQSAHELKVIHMQLAGYVLKSCKNCRLPLVI